MSLTPDPAGKKDYYSRLEKYGVGGERKVYNVQNMRGATGVGLKFKDVKVDGDWVVLVTGVAKDSPCSKAGVVEGILTAVDGAAVYVKGDVLGGISGARSDTIQLEIIPFEAGKELFVVPLRGEGIGAEFLTTENGVVLRKVFPGSPAEAAGLGPCVGKKILEVNGDSKIQSESCFRAVMEAAKDALKIVVQGGPVVPQIFCEQRVTDSQGYIWIEVPDEENALTLQPHHLTTARGTPCTTTLPSIGDVVTISNLFTPSEVVFNGIQGRVIPPGDHIDAPPDPPQAESTPSEAPSGRSMPYVEYDPQRFTHPVRPGVMGDNTVFRSMLRPPGAREPPPERLKTDWQLWIKLQQQRAAEMRQ